MALLYAFSEAARLGIRNYVYFGAQPGRFHPPLWQNGDMDPAPFQPGITLFNRGRFFDAHEALEDVWRPARGRRRRFLQALIQVAVGLHHHSRANLVGARSLLARAGNTLASYPPTYAGLKVAPLRTSLDAWRAALAEGRRAPPLPKLEFAKPVLESGPR